MTSPAKIILYSNRLCPWAHRVHIALQELGLPFREVLIPLDQPQKGPEYLQKINPRGLVPALSYNDEILIESGIIVQFLTDAYPSHLVPASNEPGGALRRARIARFVDGYLKFNSAQIGVLMAKSQGEREGACEKAVGCLVEEVEGLLGDAGPFFGGSGRLTLAEVLTASFAIRLRTLTKAGVYPKTLWEMIEERAPNFVKWSEAVSAHPSVLCKYDEKEIVEATKAKLAQMRGEA